MTVCGCGCGCQDGWFKTGDIAVWEPAQAKSPAQAQGASDQKQGLAQGQQGSFRLLGRNSIDIIKSSGYKLSALEIEREILAHPQVSPFHRYHPIDIKISTLHL